MTTEQLKACAHCDGLPLQAADTGLDYDHDTIVCDDCGATAPTAEAWNRRTPVQLYAQTAAKTERPSLGDAWDRLRSALDDHYNASYRFGEGTNRPDYDDAKRAERVIIDLFSELLAQRQDSDKDAERYRKAIAYEDNAGLLYCAVMNHCPDKAAVDAEFDAEAIDIAIANGAPK